jgi:hypothetical protein
VAAVAMVVVVAVAHRKWRLGEDNRMPDGTTR